MRPYPTFLALGMSVNKAPFILILTILALLTSNELIMISASFMASSEVSVLAFILLFLISLSITMLALSSSISKVRERIKTLEFIGASSSTIKRGLVIATVISALTGSIIGVLAALLAAINISITSSNDALLLSLYTIFASSSGSGIGAVIEARYAWRH